MTSLSRRSVLVAFGAAAVPPMVVAGARPAAAADDFYESNTKLYEAHTEGVDYARRYRRHAAYDDSEAPGGSFPDTAIVAVHGGAIEGGTSELCLAIAGYHPDGGGTTGGAVYDYWMFEGIMPSGNSRLHVTSVNCDDPVALATVGGSQRVVSLHGFSPDEADLPPGVTAAVLVGGLDTELKTALLQAYQAAGITALDAIAYQALSGREPKNIANRTTRDVGVQLELSTPLRADMFSNNTRAGRKTSMKPSFWKFVDATRQVLAG